MEKIGRGFVATVYKTEYDGKAYVLKKFDLTPFVRLFYRLMYRRKHPYSTEEGVKMAFHRRRIASELSRMWDENNYIVDVVGISGDKSFLCEYTDGRPVSKKELKEALEFINKLKGNLYEAGLPTISLEGLPSKYLPLKFRRLLDVRNILVDKNGFFKLIDFESGIPRLNRYKITFDDTDFDRLESYIREMKCDALRDEVELLKYYARELEEV